MSCLLSYVVAVRKHWPQGRGPVCSSNDLESLKGFELPHQSHHGRTLSCLDVRPQYTRHRRAKRRSRGPPYTTGRNAHVPRINSDTVSACDTVDRGQQ